MSPRASRSVLLLAAPYAAGPGAAPSPATAGWRGAARLAAWAVAASGLRLALYWWMAQPFGGLAPRLCHFDCGFYLRIAAEGYGADARFHDRGAAPNLAYFPLLPLLIRATHAATGLPGAVCGILIAHAALAVVAAVGGAYVRRTRPAPAADPGRGDPGCHDPAWLWLLVVMTAPFGIFMAMPYTEAPFAALVMTALLARARGRHMTAAAAAALAAATRPTGVLVSLLVMADQLRRLWRLRAAPDRAAAWGGPLLAFAVAPLGLSLFMAWQYAAVGDGLAFSHVQVIWDRRWLGPLTWVRLGLRAGDWREALLLFPAQSYAASAAFALLGLAAALFLAARRRFAEAWLCAAAILLPLATGLHSMGRFVGTNPAFLLAVHDAVSRLRSPGTQAGTRAAVLVLSAALQAVLLAAWYAGAGGLF